MVIQEQASGQEGIYGTVPFKVHPGMFDQMGANLAAVDHNWGTPIGR